MVDADLSVYVRAFENAEEVTREARAKSEKCQDYFDDKQLTEDEEAELRKRGQPAVVFNEIKPKVKTMLGLEKQTRKDPKAFPRNPDDEDAAQAATDGIRYVCEDSRWDDRRSSAAKNLAIQGTGAVFVGVKKTRNGIDPDVRKLAWDRFYYDPHSSDDDFEDAQFLGSVVWLELDDAKKLYPGREDALEATWISARDTDTYDDKPKYNLWADYKRKRVRLCEHYYREDGTWRMCIFTKGGFLVDPQDSPYLDDQGEPECPIKAISLYVDRDNNRYGEVQAMLSPQDEINKRRSKSLHLVSTRQLRVSPNVSMDPATVRKEMARPDGVFIGEQGDVEVLETNDMAVGNLNLMQDAREHIHRTGANSALAGKDTQSQSGRAILAQQQGGMTEAADFLDCIRRLSLAVYRSVWGRIQQHWKAERWIRVTDNENNVRFVGLNKPVTLGEAVQGAAQGKVGALQMLGKVSPELPALLQDAMAGDERAMLLVAQVAKGPKAGLQIGIENNAAEMDVDIIVDEGIDTPTIQAEQFDTIVKTIPAFASLMESQAPMAQALLKVVVQSSQLRDKDKLLEILEPEDGGQAAPGPEEMMAMQAEAAKAQMQFEAQLELEKTRMQGDTELQKAQIKAATDIEVARIRTEADAEAEAVKIETDTRLNEQRMMLDHEAKARVAEATGEARRKKEESDKGAAEKEAQLAIMQQLAAVVTELSRPKNKVPIRDENGFLVGIREEAA